MSDVTTIPERQEQPDLMIWLGWYAVFGCAVVAVSILIADFVVPDHDWTADTISDLSAERYVFIVDIGIYAFSSAVFSIAVLTAHVHLVGTRWSLSIVGLVVLGLIMFLVGARNEYGDNDSDGVVIHRYLIYRLSVLMAALPLMMARAVGRVSESYRGALIAIAVVWIPTAPVFFSLSDGIDGVYERYLGLIAFAFMGGLAPLFIHRGAAVHALNQ